MRAGIYLRISQDRTGEELGVERQREDCEALVARRGWNVERVYVDNDVSAKGDRKRPEWEAMMADVEAGRLDVVVGWTLDRTLRSGRDRLRMLESGKTHGLTIALARGSDMDLSTPAGRFAADMLGAVALHEIEAKSDRQKRAQRQAAEQGRRVGGRRPFGYEQDGITIRADEAQAVHDAYRDYLAGTPLLAIARKWNAAGLLSGYKRADGSLSEWNHSGVRSVLRNPRYMGMRRHQPRGEPSVLYPAAWPAVVDEPTWRAAVALLDSAASEFKPRGGRRLLTGIATCGACGLGIHVGGNKAGAAPVYRCPTGQHVTRRAGLVEEFVHELVVRRLQMSDAAALVADANDNGVTAALSLRATQLREEMDTIARERMQRVITPRQFAVMNAELTTQLTDVERRMAIAGRSTGLHEFVSSGVTRDKWDELGVDRQRVYIGELVESIRLFSGGRGVRKPPPETIAIRWKIDA